MYRKMPKRRRMMSNNLKKEGVEEMLELNPWSQDKIEDEDEFLMYV